jgi:hypothetical protein
VPDDKRFYRCSPLKTDEYGVKKEQYEWSLTFAASLWVQLMPNSMQLEHILSVTSALLPVPGHFEWNGLDQRCAHIGLCEERVSHSERQKVTDTLFLRLQKSQALGVRLFFERG